MPFPHFLIHVVIDWPLNWPVKIWGIPPAPQFRRPFMVRQVECIECDSWKVKTTLSIGGRSTFKCFAPQINTSIRNYVHRIVSPILNFELRDVYFTVSITFVVHDFPSFLVDKKKNTSARSYELSLMSNVIR